MRNARQIALAGVLVLAAGCASSVARMANGTRYTAISVGGSHAASGQCKRVNTDETITTPEVESRRLYDDNEGSVCATASGGRAAPGFYATIGAFFASALALLIFF